MDKYICYINFCQAFDCKIIVKALPKLVNNWDINEVSQDIQRQDSQADIITSFWQSG